MKFSLELRVPPVLLTLVTMLLMWLVSSNTPPVRMPGWFVLTAVITCVTSALATGLAGIVAFRQARTTVNPLAPDKCSRLVDSGIFRFTRNPMYLALLMALIGWSIFLGNLWSLVMVFFWAAYIDRYQIMPEEEALEAAFGDAFRQYRSKVRKWL